MGGLMDGWGWGMSNDVEHNDETRRNWQADHGLMEGRPKTADVTVDDD